MLALSFSLSAAALPTTHPSSKQSLAAPGDDATTCSTGDERVSCANSFSLRYMNLDGREDRANHMTEMLQQFDGSPLVASIARSPGVRVSCAGHSAACPVGSLSALSTEMLYKLEHHPDSYSRNADLSLGRRAGTIGC
eukprot:2685705-Prymnesium_polylepis.1